MGPSGLFKGGVMKAFLKSFFAVDNKVNEQAVMGVWFGLCATVAGFIPGFNVVAFVGFLVSSLACFGIALKKSDIM